jgi:hypothetical protein
VWVHDVGAKTEASRSDSWGFFFWSFVPEYAGLTRQRTPFENLEDLAAMSGSAVP